MTKPDFEAAYAAATKAAIETHRTALIRGPDDPESWANNFLEDCLSRRLADGRQDISSPISGLSLILTYAQKADIRCHGRITEKCAQLIYEQYKNDFDVETLARIIVSQAARGATPLPDALKTFAAEIIEFPKEQKSSRGDRDWKNYRRDQYYLTILLVLAHGFKITPTKNSVSFHIKSACDLLSKITEQRGWLYITYNGAERLWRNRKKSIYKEGLVNLSYEIWRMRQKEDSTAILKVCERYISSG
jgi:hypothetical protein